MPIVVGVDRSACSSGAIDWAADEAALHGLPLCLVYACLWERYEGPAFMESAGVASERLLAQAITDRATERAQQGRPEVQIAVDIVPEDAEAASSREARRATAVVNTRPRRDAPSW